MDELSKRRERRLGAFHMQEIEGNPMTGEDIEIFKMFDRENWSDDQRRQYILSDISGLRQ